MSIRIVRYAKLPILVFQTHIAVIAAQEDRLPGGRNVMYGVKAYRSQSDTPPVCG